MSNSPCCQSTCYRHCEPVPSCNRYLKLQTTVVSGDVTAHITDKFGHRYSFTIETDEEGIALIDLESDFLPEGLLNPYAGDFDLRVNEMKFPAGDAFYECMRFNITQSFAVAGEEPDPEDPSSYPTFIIPYVFEEA